MLEERVDHTFYIFSAYSNFSLSMPTLSEGGITPNFAQTAMSMSGVVTLSIVSWRLTPPLFTFSGQPGPWTINWIFFLNLSFCGRVHQVLFYVSFCKNVKNVNKGTSCSRAHVSLVSTVASTLASLLRGSRHREHWILELQTKVCNYLTIMVKALP